MIRYIATFILLVFFAAAVSAEEIIISTGSGPLDSVITPVKSAFEKETGIKLTILFGSASLAFKQLCKGTSEAGAVGTSFDEAVSLLKKEEFEIRDPASLRHVTLGRALVRTIVHKENPITRLNKEQLKNIFTGKFTNWQEVGGNDAPIIVVLSTLNPATIGAFRKNILDNEPFMKEVLELGHMDELRGAIEVNPDAITVGTAAILSDGTKQIDTPPVYRNVTLITRGAPSPKVQKFIDFVTIGSGKKLVKE
jgi:phosphate transport system substrate-binding protein